MPPLYFRRRGATNKTECQDDIVSCARDNQMNQWSLSCRSCLRLLLQYEDSQALRKLDRPARVEIEQRMVSQTATLHLLRGVAIDGLFRSGIVNALISEKRANETVGTG